MSVLRASARTCLRASTAAFAMGALFAQSAYAQEVDPASADTGEIIVTAQKRSQSLSDVSLSVAAVGSEQLANNNTVTLEGLQTLVPSISFGNDFNFAKLFIRGIGLSSSLPGVDPSVALHVDGAVVSLAQAQLGSMFDLERVEVLRGPQGTLYGRNSTGGAVNLITAKPTSTLDGYVRLTVGGDDLNLVGEGIHHMNTTFLPDEEEWMKVKAHLQDLGAPVVMSGGLANDLAKFYYLDTKNRLGYVSEVVHPASGWDQGLSVIQIAMEADLSTPA